MIVSEALRDRMNGSPEPDLDGGYTIFRNDKLRLVIEHAFDMERRSIDLENQMAALARRFSLALKRVSRGLSGKTGRFTVANRKNNDVLGVILWYGPWRQYVFVPTLSYETIYSPGCLRDIADFVQETTAEHRREKVRAAQS